MTPPTTGSSSDPTGLSGDLQSAWSGVQGSLQKAANQANNGAQIGIGLLVIVGGLLVLFAQTDEGKQLVQKAKAGLKTADRAAMAAAVA